MQDILSALELHGKLISKRCTEAYLSRLGLLEKLNSIVPLDFESVSDKVIYLKYGGGYCLACGQRTSRAGDGKGFAQYCRDHFHTPKKNRPAHNKKAVSEDLLRELYLDKKMSICAISKHLGNISNVTIAKKIQEYGIPRRSRSEEQSLSSGNRGKPALNRANIDAEELSFEYLNRTPISILASKHNVHPETIRRYLVTAGVRRFHRESYIEFIIREILEKHGIDYESNCRRILDGNLEIDFFLEDYKIGLELNSLYHHSHIKGDKPRDYHFKKYIMAKEKGVRLLQFWEPDISQRSGVIESMILNSCGLSAYRLNARRCVVREVDFAMASSFYSENHIQGPAGKNTKSVGLFHDNELVSLLGYSKNKDKTIITRFCSKRNHIVRGGFSKLLKTIPGDTIVTYSSNDISDGNLYSRNGFVMVKENPSDYWVTDFKDIHNRQKFMKKKLVDFPGYDDSKTELQILLENGYDAIYKSGTKTWVLYAS